MVYLHYNQNSAQDLYQILSQQPIKYNVDITHYFTSEA